MDLLLQDIEIATLEIREQQRRLEELRGRVEQAEQEKHSLLLALEMLRHKNFLLERNNENLTAQAQSTMSPLQDRQAGAGGSHSTGSLVLLSLVILLLGLVTGAALATWYNTQEVRNAATILSVPANQLSPAEVSRWLVNGFNFGSWPELQAQADSGVK